MEKRHEHRPSEPVLRRCIAGQRGLRQRFQWFGRSRCENGRVHPFNSPVWQSRAAAQQEGSAELRAQPSRAVGAIGDDAQWLRISNEGDTDTANREPRPANSTPRWVF